MVTTTGTTQKQQTKLAGASRQHSQERLVFVSSRTCTVADRPPSGQSGRHLKGDRRGSLEQHLTVRLDEAAFTNRMFSRWLIKRGLSISWSGNDCEMNFPASNISDPADARAEPKLVTRDCSLRDGRNLVRVLTISPSPGTGLPHCEGLRQAEEGLSL